MNIDREDSQVSDILSLDIRSTELSYKQPGLRKYQTTQFLEKRGERLSPCQHAELRRVGVSVQNPLHSPNLYFQPTEKDDNKTIIAFLYPSTLLQFTTCF